MPHESQKVEESDLEVACEQQEMQIELVLLWVWIQLREICGKRNHYDTWKSELPFREEEWRLFLRDIQVQQRSLGEARAFD